MGSFEFDGEKYKAGSRHQKEWGSRMVAELSATLWGREHILDLGCGDGMLTAKLAALVPEGYVVGVDASAGMIATAGQVERENAEFLHMDIDEIAFVNEFDLIFSNATLHWILDHERLLGNCHRALKTNGQLRFNFAGYGNCLNFIGVVRRRMAQSEFSDTFRSFTWPWYMPRVEDYRLLCKHGLFSEVNVWGENADRFFDSANEMIRWIDQPSLVPFLAAFKDDRRRDKFRNLVVEDMISLAKGNDGRCFEQFRRINVHAVKTASS
jgi:trans-aconitate 2-methyltransferase